ncbi:ATP-binding protein [Pseudogemmobacter humi]|uniref:histidine kinase n=1 Tax=Pseudogemmobacter humi TaxID=2483812 RepID=A0A3P5XBI6_9RHOB|nr:ATP-binding protein [Pseudogemmobacter humi]VDC32043.1 Osmolarity sensor protein EnvZ [Pseudogemmobacter humi]
MFRLKHLLPRGLYGRAALILIVPIVTIQLVVSMAFIQRHYEGVTGQMTRGVAIDLLYVLAEFDKGESAAEAFARADAVARPLQIELAAPPDVQVPTDDLAATFDFSGQEIIRALHEEIPGLTAVDVTGGDRIVRLRIATRFGEIGADIARRRMSATNPHQLLVLMLATSVLLTVIAYIFLRNQLRPIARLAGAAEAFGRGERIAYRPRGALEVRAAGRAFLEMRDRIERQIEQRMLMLSGVSHDLRTPLTRMRLALSLMPEDEDTRALQADVIQMERLVDEFLAFVRGDATEGEDETDVISLLEEVIQDARRGGGEVAPLTVTGWPRRLRLRPQGLRRAIDNLVANGLRHGRRVEIGVAFHPEELRITVEDDGPGIPEDQRERAVQPFTRLGSERDPNKGGGVGLGLSIAADIAASHGGGLRLGQGRRLGGLMAELRLAR